jgi:DNA-binding PadR family transcriptional regulator
MAAPLGEFELLVLLAVLHLGEDAYPPAVRAAIEQRAGRDVSRGAIYVTLDRLEAKRLLGSTADRGASSGRLRHVYRVTPRGRQALRRALAAVESMRAGLDPLLDEP